MSKQEWSRQQKRVFNRMTSWFGEVVGRGMQLFRVDLTTAVGGNADLLSKHHKELRRRILRMYGYKIEYFCVQTSEGNGVLHCVYAIEQKRGAFIPQSWLSEQWSKIHGAKIVWIKRLGDEKHRCNTARYIAAHYLSGGQGEIVRCSYSWWFSRFALASSWKVFTRYFRDKGTVTTAICTVAGLFSWREMIGAWREFLAFGYTVLGDQVIACEVGGRVAKVLF